MCCDVFFQVDWTISDCGLRRECFYVCICMQYICISVAAEFLFYVIHSFIYSG